MTDTMREFVEQEERARAELRSDEDLPPAVRELVAKGRQAIAAAERERQEAKAREYARHLERAEQVLAGMRADLAGLVPELASLAGYVDYYLEDLAEQARKGVLGKIYHHTVSVWCPGCHTVEIRLAWQTPQCVWVLDDGGFRFNGAKVADDLPATLAVARKAYLDDLDVPL